MAQIEQQGAVAGPGIGKEACHLGGDLGKAFAARLDGQSRRRNEVRRDRGDGGDAGRHGPTAQPLRSASLCMPWTISIRRRQIFSMNVISRSRSASLGSFKSIWGRLAVESERMPSGSGTPRAIISFLSEAFSPCSRAISTSSAARSSGTAWQVQFAVRLLQIDTWPVRVSRRRNSSSTWLKVKRPFSGSGAAVWACAAGTPNRTATRNRVRSMIVSRVPLQPSMHLRHDGGEESSIADTGEQRTRRRKMAQKQPQLRTGRSPRAIRPLLQGLIHKCRILDGPLGGQYGPRALAAGGKRLRVSSHEQRHARKRQ